MQSQCGVLNSCTPGSPGSFQKFQNIGHTQKDQTVSGWDVGIRRFHVSGRIPVGRCMWETYHVTAAYARDLNPPWPHGWTLILYFCTATGFIRISPPQCTVGAQECPWLCPRAGGRACLFVCFPRPGHGPLATLGWPWKGPLSGGVHEPQADPGRGVSLGAIPAAKSLGVCLLLAREER